MIKRIANRQGEYKAPQDRFWCPKKVCNKKNIDIQKNTVLHGIRPDLRGVPLSDETSFYF